MGKVTSAVLSVLPGGIRVASDPQNNAVMIYSDFETFVKLRDFLKTIDVAEAQVVIEATIAEVSLTDNLQYGVEAYLRAHGVRSARARVRRMPIRRLRVDSLAAQLRSARSTLSGVMQALQAVTTVKVISSPYLTVVSGKTARLVVGDQIPFASRTVNSTSNGTSTFRRRSIRRIRASCSRSLRGSNRTTSCR